jgi:hypothetical protein
MSKAGDIDVGLPEVTTEHNNPGLLEREETHGRYYPAFYERIVLLLCMIGASWVGYWMWTETNWSTLALWPATVCALPLATLIVAEMLGKIIQRIHVESE